MAQCALTTRRDSPTPALWHKIVHPAGIKPQYLRLVTCFLHVGAMAPAVRSYSFFQGDLRRPKTHEKTKSKNRTTRERL